MAGSWLLLVAVRSIPSSLASVVYSGTVKIPSIVEQHRGFWRSLGGSLLSGAPAEKWSVWYRMWLAATGDGLISANVWSTVPHLE